jgi:nitrogen-specific signal transduction histidine kinase
MEEKTYSVPTIRTSIEKILNDHDFVASQKLFTDVFGAIAGISAIINKSRQIVYANSDFLEFLGVKSLEAVLGRRTGEAVSCIHSGEELSGCGTSQACMYCGAVNAIVESQVTNQKSVRETSISSVIDGQQKSWDFKITSTPVNLGNNEFYVLSLQDISYEKRLVSLEKIFFHDLLNIASGLNGLLKIIKDGVAPEETQELIQKSEEASNNIIEEIMLYRQLRAAEDGDIEVRSEPVNSLEFLTSAVKMISSHEAGKNKFVMIDNKSYDTVFNTDRILLLRIIINLLKNALEATITEGTVLTGIENRGWKIRFCVKNEGMIPYDIQQQIFRRSFSTKGKGRGLGTYSIRLLAENYLSGKAGFTSNEKDGTIFFVDLPMQ